MKSKTILPKEQRHPFTSEKATAWFMLDNMDKQLIITYKCGGKAVLKFQGKAYQITNILEEDGDKYHLEFTLISE
jgi:hypothetical protein